jgi:hypothetical protein
VGELRGGGGPSVPPPALRWLDDSGFESVKLRRLAAQLK